MAKPPHYGLPGLKQHHRPTFFQARQVLNRLTARHGRDSLERVGHREVDAWLRSLSGLAPVTQHNHWRITRRFFGFCQDYLEVIVRNPMKRLQEPRLEHQEPAILTPGQMRECLGAVLPVPRSTAYLTLGGFAGLRSGEILHLHWEDIDWGNGEVFVRMPKRVGGWRPRLCRDVARAAAPPRARGAQGRQDPLRQRENALPSPPRDDGYSSIWESWPNNCLRHSFKTYHAAPHFQDLPKLALQMGHIGIRDAQLRLRHAVDSSQCGAPLWWRSKEKQIAKKRWTKLRFSLRISLLFRTEI